MGPAGGEFPLGGFLWSGLWCLVHSSLVGQQMLLKLVHSLEGMVADLAGEERALSI
jgi:hypothetical protein